MNWREMTEAVTVLRNPRRAQVRGVYPLGMSAIGAGILPEAGVTYANLFAFYARDQLRGRDGGLLATGHNSVLMDLNTITWESDPTRLRGARYAVSATLPFANNSLASDFDGAVSGGGGFADSFSQPAILGWTFARADIKVAYGLSLDRFWKNIATR